MDLIRHYIGGTPHQAEPERFGEVTESATGEVTARVAFASPSEVDLAVAAAKDAFDALPPCGPDSPETETP